MARFEAAIQTALRFHTLSYAPPLNRLPEPETVSIQFRGREYVWHALGSSEAWEHEPSYEYGPSVTVVVSDADDQSEAAEGLQRLLSALTFEYEHAIEAVSYGGTGDSDPMQPAVTRARRSNTGAMLIPAPQVVTVRDDERVGLSLATYREGVNAGSPFYRFLAFWNVLDAVFDGDKSERDQYLNANADSYENRAEQLAGNRPEWKSHPDLASYLRADARNAIAHVIRTNPADRHIDPDAPEDRVRLTTDSVALRGLAKQAVEESWPDPVRVESVLPWNRAHKG